MYLTILSPLIRQEEQLPNDEGTIEVWVPITARYQRIMEMLFGEANKNMKNVTKHREALFGPDLPPTTIPDLYQEIGMVQALGMDYGSYKALPIHDRAQIIAQHRLSNMMEVFKRHTEINAENAKKAHEKANKVRK